MTYWQESLIRCKIAEIEPRYRFQTKGKKKMSSHTSLTGQWGWTTHGMRSSTDNVWSFGRAPNSVIIKRRTFLNITCCNHTHQTNIKTVQTDHPPADIKNFSKSTKARCNKDMQYQGCAVPGEQVWHYWGQDNASGQLQRPSLKVVHTHMTEQVEAHTSLAPHLPLAEVKDPLQMKNLGTLRVHTSAASEVCEDGDSSSAWFWINHKPIY